MNSLPFIPTSEIKDAVFDEQGYQSPLDLNRLLLPRPASSFLLRAGVDRYGVAADDILVVDRSVVPRHYQLVVVPSEGELVLARFPSPEIWGAVTHIIHKT